MRTRPGVSASRSRSRLSAALSETARSLYAPAIFGSGPVKPSRRNRKPAKPPAMPRVDDGVAEDQARARTRPDHVGCFAELRACQRLATQRRILGRSEEHT